MSLKKSELLHIITVNLLEDLKPGIYTTDPIPKPKFCKSFEGNAVFCPYCSYPKNYFYVNKNKFYEHLKGESHLRQFTNHHFPSIDKQSFDKVCFILNNLDTAKLDEYIGIPLEMLYLQLTV